MEDGEGNSFALRDSILNPPSSILASSRPWDSILNPPSSILASSPALCGSSIRAEIVYVF